MEITLWVCLRRRGRELFVDTETCAATPEIACLRARNIDVRLAACAADAPSIGVIRAVLAYEVPPAMIDATAQPEAAAEENAQRAEESELQRQAGEQGRDEA